MNVSLSGNDLLRPGVPSLGGPMMNMNPHGFMQQQHQHPQAQHQQGPSAQMGLLQNNPNPNQMLAGGPTNNVPNLTYPSLSMQHANLQNRQVLMQGQSTQGPLNRQVPPQQINNMGGHNPPLPGINFSNGIMNPPQQPIRRVASQPTGMNHAGAHMGGMPPGMGGMSLGLNQGQTLPQHMRPGLPQQHYSQMRPQQQPHAMSGHVSPDMSIPMNRPSQIPGNGGLPPHVNRATSAQPHLMSNLGLPSGLPQPQHPGEGMQGPIHQAPFNGPGMLAHHQSQPLPGTSPHTGTYSQNHSSANFGTNMSMGTIPPSQTPGNRSQPPGENPMLMGLPNQSIQSGLPQVPRIPPPNNSFPFASSSTSPRPPGDMSQNVGGGQMNGPVHGTGQHHITTPAQLMDRMHPPSDNSYSTFISQSQSQPNVPNRPPSQQRPVHPGMPFPSQQPQPPHHQSPRPADPMTQHMGQRPHSQQGQQRPSPPQQGPSRTPRVSQPQLPNPIAARIPIPPTGQNQQPPPQQPQPPQSQGQGAPGASAQAAHPTQIPPRQPPPGPPSQAAPPQNPPAAQSQQDGGHHLPQPQQPIVSAQQPVRYPLNVIGQGQGIVRLMQMSGDMTVEKRSKEIPFWETFVRKYFLPKATMKITLWKENQRQEAKPFEIGTPILPRFFNVTTQSGVKSMSLSLDGARERLLSGTVACIECPDTRWTFRYENGYTVVLKGPFTARMVVTSDMTPGQNGYALRIEQIVFDSMTHEKLIDLEDIEGHRVASSPSAPQTFGDVDPRYDSPRWHLADAAFPAEPINAFGVPQATMRCLELAESVTQMGDLIQFSQAHGLGPREALHQLAQQLREKRGQEHGPDGPSKQSGQSSLPGSAPGSNVLDGVNGGPTPPSSLYPGTPGSSSAQPGQAPSTPQNVAHAESSKQGKASQSNAGQGSSQNMASTPSASTPAAAPTPGGSTTPAMANATLKRKAGQRADPESPAVANSSTDAPTTKRVTRKRPRTGTQGGG